jgi:SAM-dependent methyltransferase
VEIDMQALLDKLADPLDKSPVRRETGPGGDRLLSPRRAYKLSDGIPDMMVEPDEIERHFGRRNYRAWRVLQEAAESSYAVRTEGHFSVDSYQPAQDYGAVLARFSGEWLDVGCGKLARPSYMHEAPRIAFSGIDPMPLGVRRDFPFVRAMGDFLPFRAASFDGVMFSSSLDHCIVPLQALEEARRVLRPGGTLLIWETIRPEDQQFRDWAAAALYFQSRYNARHNWGFTRPSLEFVVRHAGFELTGWEETSDPREAILMDRRSAPA